MQNSARVRRILAALDAASAPEQMDIRGLSADKGRFAVWATGNYRITFAWSGTTRSM